MTFRITKSARFFTFPLVRLALALANTSLKRKQLRKLDEFWQSYGLLSHSPLRDGNYINWQIFNNLSHLPNLLAIIHDRQFVTFTVTYTLILFSLNNPLRAYKSESRILFFIDTRVLSRASLRARKMRAEKKPRDLATRKKRRIAIISRPLLEKKQFTKIFTIFASDSRHWQRSFITFAMSTPSGRGFSSFRNTLAQRVSSPLSLSSPLPPLSSWLTRTRHSRHG